MERLLERVEIDLDTECWIWQGSADSKGYGKILVGSRVDGSRRYPGTHLVVYEHLAGLVPDGQELDHLCRRRLCCNPDHLEPVSHTVNIQRGEWRNRYGPRTHCEQGHPFDEANTMVRPDGGRRCKTCKNERERARYRTGGAP